MDRLNFLKEKHTSTQCHIRVALQNSWQAGKDVGSDNKEREKNWTTLQKLT